MKSAEPSCNESADESHPARGAWIEIDNVIFEAIKGVVAPRKGCVD